MEKDRIQILSDGSLDAVAGGATVVEVKANDRFIPRCFSCHSTNLTIEHKNGAKVLTCNSCGAVDIVKE